jgi:hypothetical protein
MWYCAMAGERKGANAPMTKIAAKLLILSFASVISLFVQRPVTRFGGHFFSALQLCGPILKIR